MVTEDARHMVAMHGLQFVSTDISCKYLKNMPRKKAEMRVLSKIVHLVYYTV